MPHGAEAGPAEEHGEHSTGYHSDSNMRDYSVGNFSDDLDENFGDDFTAIRGVMSDFLVVNSELSDVSSHSGLALPPITDPQRQQKISDAET